jgi:hypothetical protein
MRALLFSMALSILASSPVEADQQTIVKNWTYGATGNGSAAASTASDSGTQLVVYCAAKKQCYIFVRSDIGCDDGNKQIFLVNAESGAEPFTMTCTKLDIPGSKSQFANSFDNFKEILNVILENHSIAIAIPLVSGMFQVVHFSLEGSNEAISAVGNLAKDAANPNPAGLHDQVL